MDNTQDDHISILQHVFPEMLLPESRQNSLNLANLDNYLEMRLQSCSDSIEQKYEEDTNSGGNREGIRVGPSRVHLFLSSSVGGEIVMEPGLKVTGKADFTTVRAGTGVASGRWMYEIYLLTKGVMQLGWCTIECRFSREKGVGDTPDSYAYDGARHRKWNVGSKKYGESWLPCDVITCAIDCDLGTVSFYRNGCSMGVAFSNIRLGPGVAYFPAASLLENETVIFNFGAVPFHYPVEGYRHLQDPPINLMKSSEFLCSHWERLLPISVDSEKNDRISITHLDTVQSNTRWLKSTCFLIAAHLMKYCQTLLLDMYTIRSHVIPLLLKFCDKSFSEEPHIHFFMQMIWSFLDTKVAHKVVTQLARALFHLYRFSAPVVVSDNQLNYLHLLRGILLHDSSKDYLLRHTLFDRLQLPSLFYVKLPDDATLSQLVPVVSLEDFPLTDDENDIGSSDENSVTEILRNSNDTKRAEFHQSIASMEKRLDSLFHLHKEILKILLRDDDFSHLDRKSSREIFVSKLHKMVQEQTWPSGATSLNFIQILLSVVREVWEEVTLKDKLLCSVNDVYLPIELFCIEESNYFDTLRLGGLFSHLRKAFRHDIYSLNKYHQERRGERKASAVGSLFSFKKFTEDVREKRCKRFLKECAYDNNIRMASESSSTKSAGSASSPGGGNSTSISPLEKLVSPVFSMASSPNSAMPSLLGENIFGSDVAPTSATVGTVYSTNNVSISFAHLLSLIDLSLWIYHKAAYAHHEKVSSNTRATVMKLKTSLVEVEEKLQRCPENKPDIREALLINKRTFEDKLLEYGRTVAWLMASVYNETYRENFFWIWRVLLNTFNEANREKNLFGFLPHFYLDSCLNLHFTLGYHLRPFLPVKPLKEFSTTLIEFASFLCRNLLDLRIVSADSRNCVLQCMITFIQQPQCLRALENVPSSEVNRLLRVLTAPYENPSWSHTNWILVRLWKGCGFAFRSYTSRVYSRNGGSEALNTKPYPSIIFQNHLKRFLSKEQDISTKFVNNILTQLNWGFSELISNMQDLRQGNTTNPFLSRYSSDSNNARHCTMFFHITAVLLRVLEMIIHLMPELFLDPSRPQSENFCSRLLSLVGQILHRTTSRNGLFDIILQQQHPGLEHMDRLQLYSAVSGILVELILQSSQPCQQVALRMCLNEPGFLITSLEYMLDGPSDSPSVSSNIRSRTTPWSSSSSSSSSAFFMNVASDYLCLRQSEEVNDEELCKLEKVIELLKRSDSLQKSDSEKCKEEDLCVICYAQANSATFKPCGHMSCRSCITYQMLSKGECFFCKSTIVRVEDFNGKEIRFK